ncbi:hypothetical protein [Desulfurococcus mucosus]|uniref:Major facilitator superfamily MFS_1 n=1 Tax=Desulfurococcus mucosus (strain ATCC 35584 / DSM 2162 / JCM 9187 / O7/1) TaxID=765177 RepID=E8R8T6_DESM0|nr:hypothetical protein [Desulfurococcus mucosus]ADV64912.1 hypothetical protein Desmu_0604 [Desulfurococcus mucosus DSM 2162]
MDLPVAAFNIGLISVMDLLVNLVAVKYFGFNAVELGILNAAWTLVFIPVVRVADKLSDAGRVGLLWRLGSFSMILLQALMCLSMWFDEKPLIYVAYMVHAVLLASTRLAVNTYIFETRSSGEWNNTAVTVSRLRLLFESAILALLAYIGFSSVLSHYIYIAALFTLAHLLGILVIHEPALKIERILYRLESTLSRAFIPVKGLLTLSYLEIGGSTPLPTRIYAAAAASTGVVVTALIGFRLGNEYLWTPLPYYLTYTLGMGVSSVLLVYGIGRAVAFALYSMIKSDAVFSRGFFALSMMVRLTALLALINVRETALIGLLLGAIYLANDIIDSNLFLIFAKSRSGYGVGLYSLIGEAVSLVGSATSGYVFTSLGPLLTIAVTGLLSVLVIPAVLKHGGG